MPRIARSLAKLRDQINARHPERSKLSDGWIGDAAHQATASDHNPNAAGVVTALDITHDPAHGVDTWRMADVLRQNKDPRVKYVISNGRIFSSVASPWQWRPYTGANKHAHHIHVSVSSEATLYDLDSEWKLDGAAQSTAAPTVRPPAGITSDMRSRMMRVIMGFEGKIPPTVFIAPDGRPEIAGITQKDHPAKYAELKTLLDAGKTQQLIDKVTAYYLEYTAPAQNWTSRAGLEFFLRDCILNRGPTGAAEILQMAMGVAVDHEIGPTTRGALAALDVDAALAKLRLARERYEDKKYPQRRSSNQWQGMLNRWNNAVAKAKEFQKEQGAIPLKLPVAVSVSIFVALWKWLQVNPVLSVLVGAAVAAVIIAVFAYIKRKDQ